MQIKISTVISTTIGDFYRRITSLVTGRSDVRDSSQALPYGVDSTPIQGARAVFLELPNGKSYIVGYLGTENITETGEYRIFSTDSNGAVQNSVHLKANGDIEIGGTGKHFARFEELKSGFDTLKADLNSLITAYNGHVHPFVGVGPGNPGTTAITPAVGTPSNASVDSSKTDKIKTA